MKPLALAYGALCYLIFFLTFLYAIGFVGDLVVPKSIDSGPATALPLALAIDLALLGLFAVQHSGMARQAFKKWWTRFVPWPIERSTYVLAASLVLILLYWAWRPLPQTIWSVQASWAVALLWVLFFAGWGIVLISTFLISHAELFGVSQVWAFSRGQKHQPPQFKTPLFYKLVRHPIYFGFVVAFFAIPKMTLGHLVFALASTAWMLIAIQLEERDLITLFGARYLTYRTQVSMILPLPRLSRAGPPTADQPG
ncbi:MAG TPA: isoprenylcysteine carboxylmethyltransferase family protein [Caulobacteraceae bacterium]|nr:isoprenylcysteine carboxylmethyltransferase family protein [Caulobacteraceae bacterium]